MPNYDYECLDCEHQFDRIVTLDDFNKAQACPECGGACKHIILTAPSVKAFVGSDRHRSRTDSWLQMVNEAQAEGIRSKTEMEVGMEQAETIAKKNGVPLENIIGGRKGRPNATAEVKKDLAKRAAAQHNLINK